MPAYFLLLDSDLLEQQIRPYLAACWTQKSFEPSRRLCAALRPAVQSFIERYHLGADEFLIQKVASGLSFDRHYWKHLVGEILLVAAAEIPDIHIAPDTICCLLAPQVYQRREVPREEYSPIQQAHFGAKDLAFGTKLYSPDRVGLNDCSDVARLRSYLEAQAPLQWTASDLAILRNVADDSEREEELEIARDWFPPLLDMYRRAQSMRMAIVCEHQS